MERHGGSAIEAARNFYPGIDPEQQERLAAKYRVWWQRARKGGESPPAQGGQRPQVVVVREAPPEPPMYALADLEQTEQLRELVALAWSDLHTARRQRDHRGIALHRQAIAELGEQLEELRRRAGSVVKLEPTPAVVALELHEESKAIRLLVEAAEALAQQQQPGESPTEN